LWRSSCDEVDPHAFDNPVPDSECSRQSLIAEVVEDLLQLIRDPDRMLKRGGVVMKSSVGIYAAHEFNPYIRGNRFSAARQN